MPAKSKPSSSGKPLGSLSVAQKLELYQIIAYAETGDTQSIIGRARKMLADAKAPAATIEPEIAALLDSKSVVEILQAAQESLVTKTD